MTTLDSLLFELRTNVALISLQTQLDLVGLQLRLMNGGKGE